ncbi:MAG: c-type cytochrome domain-containing protein, partial [Paracoccaceae bacterium]
DFMTNSLDLGGHALGLAEAALLVAATWAPAAADPVSFREDVFPILQLRCLECHQPGGEGYEKSGFDMRTYESLMKGARHGPMVVPGSIIESNLLAMIDRRTSPELWMPHGKKQLSKCERQTLRFWVAQGARNN